MPCPDDPGRPPESHQGDSFAWASRKRKRWPPASSKPPFRGCTRPQGGAVSLTAYMVPCVCVRFRPFVRFVFRLSSYGSATLGTGGWLDLTRQGLAPCKKRQACLGAHVMEVSGGTARQGGVRPLDRPCSPPPLRLFNLHESLAFRPWINHTAKAGAAGMGQNLRRPETARRTVAAACKATPCDGLCALSHASACPHWHRALRPSLEGASTSLR